MNQRLFIVLLVSAIVISGCVIPQGVVTLEPTEEPIEEPTGEPIEEPTEEPIEEPTEEPAAEATVEDAFLLDLHQSYLKQLVFFVTIVRATLNQERAILSAKQESMMQEARREVRSMEVPADEAAQSAHEKLVALADAMIEMLIDNPPRNMMDLFQKNDNVNEAMIEFQAAYEAVMPEMEGSILCKYPDRAEAMNRWFETVGSGMRECEDEE